jgi:diacylglycerol kinase family enzyme
MRAAIIINPRSGLKKTHDTADGTRLERAKRWAESAGVRADIELTTRSGHAEELAAKAVAAGIDRIVAWGGDGGECVAGALFTVAALGRARRTGDGPREAGLPRDPEAMRIALTGKIKAD